MVALPRWVLLCGQVSECAREVACVTRDLHQSCVRACVVVGACTQAGEDWQLLCWLFLKICHIVRRSLLWPCMCDPGGEGGFSCVYVALCLFP